MNPTIAPTRANTVGSWFRPSFVFLAAFVMATAATQLSAEDTTPPVISLRGSEVMTLTGEDFLDPGAVAFDDVDGDISDRILTWGIVNAQREGMYEIFYLVTDSSGNNAYTQRRIVVVDLVAPAITLLGDDPMIVTWPNAFIDPGAAAFDTFDGDLSLAVRVDGAVDGSILGGYTVTYSVADRAGNQASMRRLVVVADRTAPAIALSGSDHMTMECGSSFVDPGVTARDDHDGDISAQVVVSNGLDGSACGTYVISYAVADASGNAARVDRIVEVVDTTAPLLTVTVATPRILSHTDRFVDIGLTYQVSDACGGVVVAVSVTQDEQVGSDIDASAAYDASGRLCGLSLRAQRDNAGDGRVYLIILTATDDHGNVTQAMRTVTVVKNNNKHFNRLADNQAAAAYAAGKPLRYDSFGLRTNG
ncbi:MAG: DUF5011 domain-containing protein [Planctomycetes bacterium]|nr:DUF5011 domain-containing protein [Planctomycetota bacterium]